VRGRAAPGAQRVVPAGVGPAPGGNPKGGPLTRWRCRAAADHAAGAREHAVLVAVLGKNNVLVERSLI
jgi:hypothetical protein